MSIRRSVVSVLVTAALVSAASAASAQASTDIATRAVQIRGRFPGSVLLGIAPHAGPMLAGGVRLGRMDITLGLTVTTFSYAQTRNVMGFDPMTGMPTAGGQRTESIGGLLLYAGPTFNYALYESDDRRGRAYIGGTLVIGTAAVTAGTERGSTTTSDDESVLLYGGMAHVGGEYVLSRNFAVGLEAGYGLLFASHTGSGSSQLTTSLGTTGTFVALTGTLLLPI